MGKRTGRGVRMYQLPTRDVDVMAANMPYKMVKNFKKKKKSSASDCM